MKFIGNIKAIKTTSEKVSLMLENARCLGKENKWKTWEDYDLLKTGKYKKGQVWLSAWHNSSPHVYQAIKFFDEDDASQNFQKGSEVEGEAYKPNPDKPFWNIKSIGLKVPEVDVNEDMPPEHPDEHRPFPEDADEEARKRILAERQIYDPSTTLDMTAKDISIIRQTCVKAAGASGIAAEPEGVVDIAKRLEKYVLEGK